VHVIHLIFKHKFVFSVSIVIYTTFGLVYLIIKTDRMSYWTRSEKGIMRSSLVTAGHPHSVKNTKTSPLEDCVLLSRSTRQLKQNLVNICNIIQGIMDYVRLLNFAQ